MPVWLARVEVWTEFRLRNVTSCLSYDSSQCSSIKFRVNGNSQGLFPPIRGYPAKFYVTPSLGVCLKPEGVETVALSSWPESRFSLGDTRWLQFQRYQ